MSEKAEAPAERTPHFYLNMQILFDELSVSFPDISLHAGQSPVHLDGIRIFQKDHALSSHYLYLLAGSQADESFREYENICFLFAGNADLSCFSGGSSVLMVQAEDDLPDLLNSAQQIFEKYHAWERELQFSLNSAHPLDNMLKASLNIFNNPVFAHDHNFYILSCPRHVHGMSVWEKEKRTGRSMVPLSLIHDFKADWEYLESLNTRGPHIYSAAMRGYRILYMNLWVGARYEGRICVNELQSAILPGHFHALEFLGSFIELCIRQYNLFRLNMGRDSIKFFVDYLEGTPMNEQQIETTLQFLNWKHHDQYLCLRLEAEQQDERMHSSAATIRHIEAQIRASQAFLFRQGIVVIVNLSYEHVSAPEAISSLAYILREGLFKMGASSVIPHFSLIPQGYRQACEALQLGEMSSSMNWCHHFDDYLLEYILRQSQKELPSELLCSHKLLALREYDRENNTELLATLKTYLSLERNVLQTAKALFIHRSTLAYRLERIRKIAKINLDDCRERLVLQLSFCLMEEQTED